MISACILAKNEEINLSKCIKSLKGKVDEIVVVDNESTDRTFDVAVEMGCSAYRSNLPFDQARNVYLKEARGDWIFIIDADERISDQDINKMKAITKNNNELAAYSVKRYDYVDEGKWALTSLLRLCKKNLHLKYNNHIIHGSIINSILELNYKIYDSDIYIQHYDFKKSPSFLLNKRNLYRNTIQRQLEADDNTYYNEAWLNLFLGQEFYASGDLSKANEFIEKAISYGPEVCEMAFYCLGNLDFINNRFDRIEKLSEVLLSTKSSDYIDKGLLLQAKFYYYCNGNVQKSVEVMKKAIMLNPHYAHNYLNISIVLGDKSEEGRMNFELAKKLNPMLSDCAAFKKKDAFNMCFYLQSVVLVN